MFYAVHRIEECPRNAMGIHMPFGDSTANYISSLLQKAGAPVALAYMGRAQYENPEVLLGSANSFASAADDLTIQPHAAAKGHAQSYFLGTEAHLDNILPRWNAWALKPDTLEPTYFSKGKSTHERTIGWWAMQENLIWAVEESTVEAIRKALVTLHHQ